MKLPEYLADEGARIEEALLRAVSAIPDRVALDAATLDAVRHGVTGGGKRLRPILCVTAWRAARVAAGAAAAAATREIATPEAVYDLAASLEMIHAYSLMHDDLPCMDDAELRRGRPTTHRVHGDTVTMRAGALLIPAAALQALEACRTLGCDDATGRAAARALLEGSGAGGMVGGQWLDLLGEGRALAAADLDDLHRRKTGALLTASLVVGAVAAGADETVREGLAAYGRAIGLAFQIADDLLDATASAEALGKNPSDAELDKSTYVSLYGLEEAGARARAEVDRALAALDGAGIASPPLAALARYVVERDR